MFLNLIRGHPGKLPPPVDSMEGRWSPAERAAVEHRMMYSAVGSPETVRRRLEQLLAETKADEIIATAQIFDHAARLRSFEIAAEVFREINQSA
jgi:alkanesulfonate monooxygenase SsuD/methylene tetrahydromethanopterin reductase-like flavin-dependent oxidoreductase (luciferase family)